MKLLHVLSLCLVGFSQAQTKESNAASSKCPAPKQLARNDDGFTVQLSQPNIVYIYAGKTNSFLVVNTELTLFVILDGSNKTIYTSDAKTGYGGMFNPKIDLVYSVIEKKHPFDISKVLQGDFSVVESLIDFSLLFTNKVVGPDINTTLPEYAKISTVLQDYATTTDFTKWVSYKHGHDVNKALYDFNMDITIAVNKLLNNYNNQYPVEWGAMVFFVAASEYYKKEEECQSAFIDVMVKLANENDLGFNSKLMDNLYNIVSAQKNMTKKEAIQKYNGILKM